MELANPHPTPQAASGNTEDKFMLMPPSPVAQDIPATPLAVDSGENAANVVLKTDIKRKRRTTDDLLNLKKAITEDYKRGIPLKFIAKKYDARIELVYKLFCNLQEERALPEQAVNYTIIETPKAFKEILKKFGHPDTDMIKIEKNPNGTGLVVSTFEV